ncbi:hypothetical protein [Akkermansia sp.]|uniref:hypothetical protein n=1 Tax=Akkermansia sp. TaxID=1872421 RepID=UPI0025BFCFEF|nr:hypothetical protein [Akkermansia sp.]MCC8148616.1 hypothetical protein [Akkermansia sp.]
MTVSSPPVKPLSCLRREIRREGFIFLQEDVCVVNEGLNVSVMNEFFIYGGGVWRTWTRKVVMGLPPSGISVTNGNHAHPAWMNDGMS